MARFRGTIQGHRGEASRLGTSSSGLEVDAGGWDIGVRVTIGSCPGNRSEDYVEISLTGGSNSSCQSVFLGTFVRSGKRIKVSNADVLFDAFEKLTGVR
jgi:hypothetical protein